MAYVRNEWKENDIITAEKLNNLEEGCDDIFDLGVVDITFPTEENPSVSIEENLTEEQVEKLWNAKRVKFSVMYSGTPMSFILNLFQEMPDSITNPQAKIDYYSTMMVSQEPSSLSITSVMALVELYPNNSSFQSSYSLSISQKVLS